MIVPSFSNTSLQENIYIFPVSFAQQRLWFLDQVEPNSATYNIPSTIHLQGPLNVSALKQSLNTIVERHEILRTTFRAIEGDPVQIVTPTLTLPLVPVDLQGFPEHEREAKVLQLTTEEAQRPFNLEQGPLVRTALLQLNAEEHILLLTMHHIISDAWSIGVFLRELGTLYEAFSAGCPSPLPDLPIQYADFTIWQREWLQGEALDEQVAYWKQQLQDAPAVLELPADRPRPPIPTSRGSTYSFSISRHLTDALKALSLQEGVTLYMTLLAAFNTLLYRYSGQNNIVVGSPVAGRSPVETEELIGFFVNMLPLRADLSGNPIFYDLLRQVREVSLQAQTNQDVPFEHLVQVLQPERHLGQNPIFQVLFSLQPALSGLPSGWTLHPGSASSKFDLSLICEEQAQGLVGWFEYRTDLFDADTIARMFGHWQTLLDDIVDDPQRRLSELSLLTKAERQQLLVEWNATTIDYPQDECIHRLIEAQVERTPDAIALLFQGQKMTYRELNERANQLAHHLQRLGVGPEVLVGLCVERSFEMIVGILGILKAGGAYVPVDPLYPQERQAFMLQDAQVPVLLTQQRLVEGLPEHGAQIICLDTFWKTRHNEADTNPDSGVQPANIAYMIYTSGSTGKPKGVMNTHRGLVNRLHWMQQEYGLTEQDQVLQKTPFSFDVSVWEFFWPLLSGARLVVARPDGHQDTTYLAAVIADQHITTLHFVPSMLQAFLLEPHLERCRSLKRVICSGEALPFELQERFFARFPDVALHNLYGPTEAAIDVTYWACRPGQAVTIGRPIANTQLYILNEVRQPVPMGVAGELYIGGIGIARGYFNRPELTAEKFIADPFSQSPDARLFKTGDLARYRSDGAIEFLGRLDYQVKIRGMRIELGEIEVLLSQYPGVREAVVVVREDVPDDKRLIAYLVQDTNRSIVADDVRHYLKNKLPQYMLPSAFILLASLPLTPNGKTDRKALPAPASVTRTTDEVFVAPTSLLQYQIAQIWEDLLNIRPIGIRDNFFYLGGYSLLAVRLMDRIAQICGKRLPLTVLLTEPTIENLANALQSEAKEETGSQVLLVALQTNGSRFPFFYLHGVWNSEAFYCLHLVRHLGPDQPFYALEPYHFNHKQVVAPTIEAMAAANIQLLRSIQPEGPYYLGGFCNGGLVAYEMARQLSVQGQKVNLLALINPAHSPIAHKIVRGLITRAGKILQISQERQLEWFLRLRHIYKYMCGQRRLEKMPAYRGTDLSIERFTPTTEALHQDDYGMYDWIIGGYNYAPYPGKLTLLWARQSPFGKVWRRKAMQEQNTELRFIPGTHLSCLTDHIQSLAEELDRSLNRVQAEGEDASWKIR